MAGPDRTFTFPRTGITHLGRRLQAEKDRHQFLINGGGGADGEINIDQLVHRGHAEPTETDWWWKRQMHMPFERSKLPQNLVHVKTVGDMLRMEGWGEVLKYMEQHPLVGVTVSSCTSYQGGNN